MHPRTSRELTAGVRRRAAAIVAFVRQRGTAHQRDIVAQFDHGKTTNYWGRVSNATTHLLGILHYHSFLRVVRRHDGLRVYAAYDAAPAVVDGAERAARIDALVDVIVRAYAPLPAPSLNMMVARLRYAVPQWTADLKPALQRAKQRLEHAHVDGAEWYWPANERADRASAVNGSVRFLSPFDPIV